MLEGDGYRCWNCSTDKEEGSEYWQVKIIMEDGKIFFVPCCCEICANKAKKKYENLHLGRYENVKNQSIQKRIWQD